MNRNRPVLVAHSYFMRFDPKQWERMEPYLPLGTLSAASSLRREGHDVHVFDAMLADGVEQFFATLDHVQPAIVTIVEDNFNYLTKMCTTRMRDAAFRMIRACKEAGCRIAVNGSDATDRVADYLQAGADAVVIGEPEETLAELVATWRSDPAAALVGIPGLALLTSQAAPWPKVVRTPPRGSINDLDDLAPPAWDLIDVQPYRDKWNHSHNRFSWNLVASRGCPYKCNWCAKPVFGSRYAQRSPRSLALELAHVLDKYRPDHIWYADDIFGLTGDWIESFSAEVSRVDARVPFMMQSRANLMTPRVVHALQTAGAEEVWLGAESGSQQVLDAMEKGTTIQQIRDATHRLQDAGIRVGWFIQLGYPGEEWPDILKTRDLIREARPDDIGVSVSYPLPGTKFFENVKNELGPKTNWRDSAELAMMFRGTYSTEIYRRTRDVLHAELTTKDGPGLEREWDRLDNLRRRHNSTQLLHASG